jgi:hypothetical protein
VLTGKTVLTVKTVRKVIKVAVALRDVMVPVVIPAQLARRALLVPRVLTELPVIKAIPV